jgi:phage/plasmid-associated DNA primase
MKQPGNPFIINGLIIISSNELLQLGDLTSGLSRRRVVLFFNRKPTNVENLITLVEDKYTGIFVNELSLLLSYCLNLNIDLVSRFMSKPMDLPLLKTYFIHNLQFTNHVVDFIIQYLFYLPSNPHILSSFPISYLPLSKESSIPNYKDFNIYHIYLNFCKINNIKPLSLNHFSHLLIDNLNYLYPHDNISFHNASHGKYLSQFVIKDVAYK